MSLWEKLFGKSDTSAKVAKDRLTLVLAHERAGTAMPFIDELKKDLIEVIKKYIDVEQVNIKTDQNNNVELLEVEVVLGKNAKK